MKVFVFGSNLAGRHGRGAARTARDQHGAVYGQGKGFQGASYAIPTKDERLDPLPLEEIFAFVSEFLHFARQHPQWEFEVTPVGCGLAGYTPAEIGPMFAGAPPNCHLPDPFKHLLLTSNRSAAREPVITAERICLSRGDACKRLGISMSTLKLLVARGELKEIAVGRRRLIPVKELSDFISTRLAQDGDTREE